MAANLAQVGADFAEVLSASGKEVPIVGDALCKLLLGHGQPLDAELEQVGIARVEEYAMLLLKVGPFWVIAKVLQVFVSRCRAFKLGSKQD